MHIVRNLLIIIVGILTLSGCEIMYLAKKAKEIAKAPQEVYQPNIVDSKETATLSVVAQNGIGITVYPNADCYSKKNPEKKSLSGGWRQSVRSSMNGAETYTFKVNANQPFAIEMGYTGVGTCSSFGGFFFPKANSVYDVFMEVDMEQRKCIMRVNETVSNTKIPVAMKHAGFCKQ